MRRRGTVSRKPAKTQHRKPTRPKRSKAARAARPGRSTVAGLQEQVGALTRELAAARKQQTATSDVLKVISRSAFDLQADLGKIHADQTRLRQSLLNLASNANKFTEKGTVTIDAREGGPPRHRQPEGHVPRSSRKCRSVARKTFDRGERTTDSSVSLRPRPFGVKMLWPYFNRTNLLRRT